MVLASIIVFFVLVFFFGLGLTLLAKQSDNFLERNLMRIGIGLGAFVTFGLLLNLLRIPLDWKIFLAIGILSAALFLWKNRKSLQNNLKNPKFKLTKTDLFILLMLLLFFITFSMYHKGAFIYPYLEDDDPWAHAMGVKYVAIEKTVFEGPVERLHYLDPYPPAYDMILGILHQTNDSVFWTLKYFNALIVSLSIIFFFFFAKVFTNSTKKALFSTFALFAVPAFLSHFIWALSLTMTLFFVSFYAVEKIKDDKRWWIISAIVIAATLTSSPTHSTYFGLFYAIYFVAKTIIHKKILLYEFLSGFFGLLISFIFWWMPMLLTYGYRGVLSGLGLRVTNLLNVGGTGDRPYTLSDFVFAKMTNMINNPIGIGVILSILTVVGLIFLLMRYRDMIKNKNSYILITILWFFFTLYAVNAARFAYKISPFRAWMLLAIPVSLLSGEGINLINNFVKGLAKSFTKSNKIFIAIASILVLGLIAYGVVMTSFIQKYTVNTAQWPPGAFWTSNEEIQGYLWFKDNIPSGTKVFTFSDNSVIIGLDKFICHWCDDVIEYQRSGLNETVEENYDWLKKGQYRYIVIDGQAARKFGAEDTNRKIQEFIDSDKFNPVFNNNGMVLFEIV